MANTQQTRNLLQKDDRISLGSQGEPLRRNQAQRLGDIRRAGSAGSCQLGAPFRYAFMANLLQQPIWNALISLRLNYDHCCLQ
ncbi:MAG: hypothetical protein DI562_00705 [Stenotrophomonas acidaminiphila]|nr:MAG: hypothetical protein DI562_00705 [Stenotrophomonas acidaminiphila]